MVRRPPSSGRVRVAMCVVGPPDVACRVAKLSKYCKWDEVRVYINAPEGWLPTRHTHKWDGLHTRHLLESTEHTQTHTNTHKHTQSTTHNDGRTWDMPGDPGLPGFWALRSSSNVPKRAKRERPAVHVQPCFWFMAGLWDGSGEVRGKGVGAWWGIDLR